MKLVRAYLSSSPSPTSNFEYQGLVENLQTMRRCFGIEEFIWSESSFITLHQDALGTGQSKEWLKDFSELDFVTRLPSILIQESSDKMKELALILDKFLWQESRMDSLEAQATPFLELYRQWYLCLRLKAINVLLQPRLVTSLAQLLSGDERDLYGDLAMDIERWFYSNLGDIFVGYDYVGYRTAQAYRFQKKTRQIQELMTRVCTYPKNAEQLEARKKDLDDIVELNREILQSPPATNQGRVTIAVSNAELMPMDLNVWKNARLAKDYFVDPVKNNGNFCTCFCVHLGFPWRHPTMNDLSMEEDDRSKWDTPESFKRILSYSDIAFLESGRENFIKRRDGVAE